MFSEISAAIASAKYLGELINAANDLKNHNEISAAFYEVHSKLMTATAVALASQEKQSALIGEVAQLKEQLRETQHFERQRERYRLSEFPETGALAYKRREPMDPDEPMHYLCASCLDQGKISKLQPFRGRNALYCCICEKSIQTHTAEAPSRRVISHGYQPDGGW